MRALVIDPEFLSRDEPASMLDVSLQAEVLNLLRSLANTEGIGVSYISHDLATLTRIADRPDPPGSRERSGRSARRMCGTLPGDPFAVLPEPPSRTPGGESRQPDRRLCSL